MKKVFCIIFIATVFACKSKTTTTAIDSAKTDSYNIDSERKSDSIQVINRKKKFVPYKLTKDYLVIDTGYYAAGSLEGYYAIVKNNSKIDTIDLGVGIMQISNDKYFYRSLTKYNSEFEDKSWPGTLSACPNHYIITFNDKELLLDKTIEGFDTYRSAPNLINGKIYFWQFKKIDSIYKVYAAEYNTQTRSTKSYYLFSGDLTDNEHISSPYDKNNLIQFVWEKRSWDFSNEFKLIK